MCGVATIAEESIATIMQIGAHPVTCMCFLEIDGSQLLYAINEGNFI